MRRGLREKPRNYKVDDWGIFYQHVIITRVNRNHSRRVLSVKVHQRSHSCEWPVDLEYAWFPDSCLHRGKVSLCLMGFGDARPAAAVQSLRRALDVGRTGFSATSSQTRKRQGMLSYLSILKSLQRAVTKPITNVKKRLESLERCGKISRLSSHMKTFEKISLPTVLLFLSLLLEVIASLLHLDFNIL